MDFAVASERICGFDGDEGGIGWGRSFGPEFFAETRESVVCRVWGRVTLRTRGSGLGLGDGLGPPSRRPRWCGGRSRDFAGDREGVRG